MDSAPAPPPAPHPAATMDERGIDQLPSLVRALLEDKARLEQARDALADSGDLQIWAVRFALLGDENRLKILFALHRSPGITVGDVASVVGMSDNAASHALSAMRIAGVVGVTRDGRHRRWSITDDEVHDILHSAGATHVS